MLYRPYLELAKNVFDLVAYVWEAAPCTCRALHSADEIENAALDISMQVWCSSGCEFAVACESL